MIVILCGKSGSGKDTLLTRLKSEGFNDIVTTTSRPMREGEKDGREYNFITKKRFLSGIKSGKFLEYRSYDTLVNGIPDTWFYGTPKKAIDELDADKNYVVILDLEGAASFKAYDDSCKLFYIDVPDKIRKERASKRGGYDETEWNRRVLDDEVKFSPSNIKNLGCICLTNDKDEESLYQKFAQAFETH